MRQLFKSFWTVLYVIIRGPSTVQTELTTLEYTYRHRVPVETRRIVVFRCRQFRHTTRFKKWYMINSVRYTYLVEMVKLNDRSYTDYHVGHYPQFCSDWFSGTTYPHRLAINAHIDLLDYHNP